MIAGYAMLILALGALVMVLCVGFGDTDDEEQHGAVEHRDDVPHERSPCRDTALGRPGGSGLRLG